MQQYALGCSPLSLTLELIYANATEDKAVALSWVEQLRAQNVSCSVMLCFNIEG